MNDRRWVMSAALASGSGRATLLNLERRAQAASGSNGTSDRVWGERCWIKGQPHVLVAVPYNPAMPEALQQLLAQNLDNLE